MQVSKASPCLILVDVALCLLPVLGADKDECEPPSPVSVHSVGCWSVWHCGSSLWSER